MNKTIKFNMLMAVSLLFLFILVSPLVGGISNKASVFMLGLISGIASYRAGFDLVSAKTSVLTLLISVLLLQILDVDGRAYFLVLLAAGWSISKIAINLIIKTRTKTKGE